MVRSFLSALSEIELTEWMRHGFALPSGTYTLMASFARGENMEYGEASITVPDHDISGVTMRLSSVASIPIQVLARLRFNV